MAVHPWMCSLALRVRDELLLPSGVAVKWSLDQECPELGSCLCGPTCLGLVKTLCAIYYHVIYITCIHAGECACRKVSTTFCRTR